MKPKSPKNLKPLRRARAQRKFANGANSPVVSTSRAVASTSRAVASISRVRERRIEPSVRRVRAQRKFAQGANAPAAVASTSCVRERRREPRPEPRILHNHVPVDVLLDMVSIYNVHPHLQPVVLLERLRTTCNKKDDGKVPDSGSKETNDQANVRPPTPPPVPPPLPPPQPQPPQPAPAARAPAPAPIPAAQAPAPVAPAAQAAASARPLAAPPATKVKRARRTRRIVTPRPWNMTLRPKKTNKQRQPKRNATKAVATDAARTEIRDNESFTFEDNKPLTYFAGQNNKSNGEDLIPKKMKKTSHHPGRTRANLRANTASTSQQDDMDAIHPYEEQAALANALPNIKDDPNISDLVLNTAELAPDGVIETHDGCMPIINVHVKVPNSGSDTPEAAPSPHIPKSSGPLGNHCKVDDAAHYYNEHGINRWILDNRRSPSPGPSCVAASWKTLKEVVTAPLEELDARCTYCKICTIIDKLFKLSSMIRKQGWIPTDDGCVPAKKMMSPDSDNENLYMELLPINPNLLIKLKVQRIHDRKILSARLVPRSDAIKTNELVLQENEYLFDQLIETLTLSFGESHSSLPPTPKPGSECALQPKPGDGIVDLTQPSQMSVKSDKDSDVFIAEHPPTYNRNIIETPSAKLVDAPVFHPTAEEFSDPVAYFEKIAPYVAKYGLCKVVSPAKFTPKCKLDDNIRFNVTKQYISRLYNRWGHASRELCAIKACLSVHKMIAIQTPVIYGIEVNLTKLYNAVQRYGGLEKVYNNKRWMRVAESLNFKNTLTTGRKLSNIYVKYLLPYDTLSQRERQEIIRKVETNWNRRNQKMLDRALNPLHRQKRLLDESESSGEETEDEDDVGVALAEAEDCIVPGPCMNLGKFKKVAAIALENNFRTRSPATDMVVEKYWRLVLLGTEHVCVNSASIDTGEEGYGFSKNSRDPYYKHPWNLKMLSQNSGNVLRSLGSVLGVTVPSLHLGMIFSTSCWHSDPHGLPWIEYMHQGAPKMWYAIPDEQSRKFRQAVERLCPTSCQNKSIWLPSDITMIPPTLLLEHNVSLCKVVQNPGEFILVMPKAYCSSICTGYSVTESVYFATHSWLSSVHRVFQEVRASCEPTMFSMEQLLLGVAKDPHTPLATLQQVHATLSSIVSDEIEFRNRLLRLQLTVVHDESREHIINKKRRNAGPWNMRDLDECDVCRMTLYLSKVSGLTGRRSSVCLQHALRLLETPRTQGLRSALVVLVLYVSTEELNRVIEFAQQRLAPGAVED